VEVVTSCKVGRQSTISRTRENARTVGEQEHSTVRQVGFMAFYLVLTGKCLDTFRLIN